MRLPMPPSCKSGKAKCSNRQCNCRNLVWDLLVQFQLAGINANWHHLHISQVFPGLKRTAIFPLTAEGPITSNAQNFFQGMKPETIKLRPFWSFQRTSKHYLVGSRFERLWSEFHGWSTTINNIDPWARDPTVPSSPSHNSFDRSIQNGGSQFFNDVVSAWCLVTRTIALIWPYTVRALYPRSLWSLEHSSHFTPRSACHCRRFGQVKLLTISIFQCLSISLKIWNGQAREPGEPNLIPHHSRKKTLTNLWLGANIGLLQDLA